MKRASIPIIGVWALALSGCAFDFTKFTTSDTDILLLDTCPIMAALGTTVSMALSDFPTGSMWTRVAFVVKRLVAGIVLGFVIALYLVGMIKQQSSDIGRVLALCVLAGYQAPNLWFSQERVVRGLIEKELKRRDR